MSGLDRTGPEGKGSQTGRGLGRCGGTKDADDQEKTVNSDDERGLGLARGRRSGTRGNGGRGLGRGGAMRNARGGRGRGRGAS
jgi:hypothetical protein